ncbi:MAG TPA: LysE family transporter [Steroidobacteraceae bacterium]|nr:LysE family transporter [Steroidobacteraceae bacterium]
MDPILLAGLKGLGVGFSIAAPVGPIGLLCIRRSLSGGWPLGFATGMGAASADMVYGLVAAAGLTAVTELLVGARQPLQFAGGAALILLGLITLRAETPVDTTDAPSRGLAVAYATTFLLTLANPATILSFAAVMAGLGAMSASGETAALVAGVFAGSALWWLMLSGAVTLVRHRLAPEVLVWINRASGAAIMVFGILALTAAML